MTYTIERASTRCERNIPQPVPEAFMRDGMWAIELDGLDELVAFVQQHEAVMLEDTKSDKIKFNEGNFPSWAKINLLIVDDYL